MAVLMALPIAAIRDWVGRGNRWAVSGVLLGVPQFNCVALDQSERTAIWMDFRRGG